MTTFVLVPGAGGSAWYWHRLVPLLRSSGHEAIAVDLPGDDEEIGLSGYAGLVGAAVAGRREVVLVAQSLGGFTASLVAGHAGVQGLVLVNAMIPQPGETPGDWWEHTGWLEARVAAAERLGYPTEFDPAVYFLHDVPEEVVAAGEAHQRPESDAVFRSVWALHRWPDVPTQVVVGRDDRFFPPDFQARIARDRLRLSTRSLPGGHLIALAHPEPLAELLSLWA
jgi:pimeloyl-ACP methyl ester carboxylesterase